MKPALITDIDNKRIYFWISVVSISLSIGFYYFSKLFPIIFDNVLVILLDFGSAFGFFASIVCLFNKYIWRWPFWRSIGLISYPDFTGIWVGNLTSYSTNGIDPIKIPVELSINQSWLYIEIILHTKESDSTNRFAYMYTDNSKIHISYEYINKPLPSVKQAQKMYEHHGFCILTISDNHSSIDGEYTNDTSRLRRGSFTVKKQ
jgi:hypothetical protein